MKNCKGSQIAIENIFRKIMTEQTLERIKKKVFIDKNEMDKMKSLIMNFGINNNYYYYFIYRMMISGFHKEAKKLYQTFAAYWQTWDNVPTAFINMFAMDEREPYRTKIIEKLIDLGADWKDAQLRLIKRWDDEELVEYGGANPKDVDRAKTLENIVQTIELKKKYLDRKPLLANNKKGKRL